MFLLLLKRNDGREFKSGASVDFLPLKATTIEESRIETETIIERDYIDDSRIDRAFVLAVSDLGEEVDLWPMRRRRLDKEQAKITARDVDEYERLKRKLNL